MSASDHLSEQFVDLFHATDHRAARSIKKSGLRYRPGAGSEDDPEINYTLADRFGAEDHGGAVVDQGEGYSLVHLRIPRTEEHEYLHPPLGTEGERVWAMRKKIPPAYVHAVHRVAAEEW